MQKEASPGVIPVSGTENRDDEMVDNDNGGGDIDEKKDACDAEMKGDEKKGDEKKGDRGSGSGGT